MTAKEMLLDVVSQGKYRKNHATSMSPDSGPKPLTMDRPASGLGGTAVVRTLAVKRPFMDAAALLGDAPRTTQFSLMPTSIACRSI
jgi:hypothetical protein